MVRMFTVDQTDEWAFQIANRIILTCALLGQAVLATNIVWSHFHGIALVEVPLKPWIQGRPRRPRISPAGQFGWVSVLFGIIGILLLWDGWTFPRIPVRFRGSTTIGLLPAIIPLIAALPFALFALGYWVFARRTRREVDESSGFAHLIVTLVALSALVSAFTQLQASAIGGMDSSSAMRNLHWGIGTALFSVILFFWNLFGRLRQNATKVEPPGLGR